MLNPNLRTQIIQLAHAAYPKEICGLVLDDETFFLSENKADNPELDFVIDPQLWATVERSGTISAIAHSHTNGNNSFSSGDIRSIKALGIPWYLFSLPDGKEVYFDPNENAPYLGREWHYGIWDCYSLMRDWYKQELGIELDDFERGEEFDWLSPGWNKFIANFEKQGFIRLSDDEPIKLHDAILMQIEAREANHVGVIVDLEKMHMLHHLYGRLSEIGVYGGYFAKSTTNRWRHSKLLG